MMQYELNSPSKQKIEHFFCCFRFFSYLCIQHMLTFLLNISDILRPRIENKRQYIYPLWLLFNAGFL